MRERVERIERVRGVLAPAMVESEPPLPDGVIKTATYGDHGKAALEVAVDVGSVVSKRSCYGVEPGSIRGSTLRCKKSTSPSFL